MHLEADKPRSGKLRAVLALLVQPPCASVVPQPCPLLARPALNLCLLRGYFYIQTGQNRWQVWRQGKKDPQCSLAASCASGKRRTRLALAHRLAAFDTGRGDNAARVQQWSDKRIRDKRTPWKFREAVGKRGTSGGQTGCQAVYPSAGIAISQFLKIFNY